LGANLLPKSTSRDAPCRAGFWNVPRRVATVEVTNTPQADHLPSASGDAQEKGRRRRQQLQKVGRRRVMGTEETAQVRLRRAATGRRRDDRDLGVDDVVRLEIRLPAAVAAALFDQAHSTHEPVSRVAARLLRSSLDVPRDRP